MSRSASFVKPFLLLALVLLCVPAKSQITIDPGDILGKIFGKPKAQAKPNVPASQSSPPVNDNFANRTQLTGTDVAAAADNRGATVEAGEPTHILDQETRHTVWWTWTAPAKGEVSVDTLKNVSGTTATSLAVYTGEALGSLDSVAHKNGSTDGFALAFPVRAETAY